MAGLTELEFRVLGYVQRLGRSTIATGDLVVALGISSVEEKKVLSRMARRGLIARVRRGLYLAPQHIPAGGVWAPSQAQALTTLMSDRKASYQVSGPSAFSQYGWDEQVPNWLFVYNDRISGVRQVGRVQITFAKVHGSRLGSTRLVRTAEGIGLVYASRARALMDAVHDWSRFNSLPRAYTWIRREVARQDAFAADLVDVTLRYANQGTIRRIGWILSSLNVSTSLLRRLEKSLRRTSSYIPMVPNRPKRGTIDNRWKVVINDGE